MEFDIHRRQIIHTASQAPPLTMKQVNDRLQPERIPTELLRNSDKCPVRGCPGRVGTWMDICYIYIDYAESGCSLCKGTGVDPEIHIYTCQECGKEFKTIAVDEEDDLPAVTRLHCYDCKHRTEWVRMESTPCTNCLGDDPPGYFVRAIRCPGWERYRHPVRVPDQHPFIYNPDRADDPWENPEWDGPKFRGFDGDPENW